jgi:hypothetical protein
MRSSFRLFACLSVLLLSALAIGSPAQASARAESPTTLLIVTLHSCPDAFDGESWDDFTANCTSAKSTLGSPFNITWPNGESQALYTSDLTETLQFEATGLYTGIESDFNPGSVLTVQGIFDDPGRANDPAIFCSVAAESGDTVFENQRTPSEGLTFAMPIDPGQLIWCEWFQFPGGVTGSDIASPVASDDADSATVDNPNDSQLWIDVYECPDGTGQTSASMSGEEQLSQLQAACSLIQQPFTIKIDNSGEPIEIDGDPWSGFDLTLAAGAHEIYGETAEGHGEPIVLCYPAEFDDDTGPTDVQDVSAISGVINLDLVAGEFTTCSWFWIPTSMATTGDAEESTEAGANDQNGSTGTTMPADSSSTTVQPGSAGNTVQPGSSGTTVQPGSSGTTAQPGSSGTTVQPGSSGTTAQPSSSGTTVQPGSSGAATQPGSTSSTTMPGSTNTTVQPGSSGTTVQPGSPGSTTQPGSTGTTVQPGSTGTTVQPGSTGATTQPGSASSTTTMPGSTGTTTQPGSTSSNGATSDTETSVTVNVYDCAADFPDEADFENDSDYLVEMQTACPATTRTVLFVVDGVAPIEVTIGKESGFSRPLTAGPHWMGEYLVEGYGDPIVFCFPQSQETPNTITDVQVMTYADTQVHFELAAGEPLECNWFNIPSDSATTTNPPAQTTGGVDSDEDGLTDEIETELTGTDPLNPDMDGDGLTDGDEYNVYITNYFMPDTDFDGVPDGEEIKLETEPLSPDTDGDGVSDGDEVSQGTDPLTPN